MLANSNNMLGVLPQAERNPAPLSTWEWEILDYHYQVEMFKANMMMIEKWGDVALFPTAPTPEHDLEAFPVE